MILTKTIKVKLKRPIDASWKETEQILRDLRYYSCKVLNLTIQRCYEWMKFQFEYKETHGKYPKDKDIFGCVLTTKIYRECTAKFKIFNTDNLSQTIRMAHSQWNLDKKDIMRLQKSIPSYKLNSPIFVTSKNCVLKNEDGIYTAAISLLSPKYNKHTRYTFELICKDPGTESILNRLITNQYKQGFAKIINDERKRSWFLNISYSFEPSPKILDKNRILGVDLGIVYPLYLAVSDSLHRYKIEGGEIERFRKSIERRKNQLLKQGKYCGQGRKGRGIKKRISPTEFAKERVANFRNTTNHKYSQFVVEIALKHQCGIIQMEDLTGINGRKDGAFLKNWSYYDLQKKIEYKAAEHGIEVRYIKPEYTSQRCSSCGYINEENRVDQKTFKCLKCGFEANADYNAAKNIATPNIETIIKETLAKQNKEN